MHLFLMMQKIIKQKNDISRMNTENKQTICYSDENAVLR